MICLNMSKSNVVKSMNLGMASIAGLPTVVGGVSSNQFLSSIEVLDNSRDDNAPLGLEWRIGAHTMATPRYDFALSAVPITQVLSENMLNTKDVCGKDDGKHNLIILINRLYLRDKIQNY